MRLRGLGAPLGRVGRAAPRLWSATPSLAGRGLRASACCSAWVRGPGNLAGALGRDALVAIETR
eukprot:4901236-Lingulodinium_polyedra.AAC.1